MIVSEFTGNASSRGEQHGERFGPAIRESGILDFFRDYCEKEFLGGPDPGLGGHMPIAAGALRALHGRFSARLSTEARDLVAGFCRAGRFEEKSVLQALVMPDAINFLIGASGRLTSVPTLGCTSVAAWGGWSEGGGFVYGRNLDFIGNGLWDEHQLVARHRPDKGIPYVSLSSAGCLLDGITGINEEGLTVDLHQHISADVGYWPGGRPILDLGLEVLSRARSIEEAVALIEANPTSSGWSLVLTHWKARRAAVCERTPRSFGVRHFEDGVMAWTNTYRSPALRSRELDAPAFRESSRQREARAWSLLEENRGRVNASTVASILGDHVDAERGLTRAFAQCIAYPNNLTSVVIEPEKGVLWLGEGPAPMCDSAFRRVELWRGEGEPGPQTLMKPAALSSTQSEGVKDYVAAIKAWQLRRDSLAATASLASAVAKDPQDPAYRMVHGLFQLQRGDWEGAAATFEVGAALPDLPHRSACQRYWRARALDVLDRRAEASALYGEAARSAAFAPLRKAAERGASSRRKTLGRVLPDLCHADAFAY